MGSQGTRKTGEFFLKAIGGVQGQKNELMQRAWTLSRGLNNGGGGDQA